jgi:hypothetical protein
MPRRKRRRPTAQPATTQPQPQPIDTLGPDFDTLYNNLWRTVTLILNNATPADKQHLANQMMAVVCASYVCLSDRTDYPEYLTPTVLALTNLDHMLRLAAVQKQPQP